MSSPNLDIQKNNTLDLLSKLFKTEIMKTILLLAIGLMLSAKVYSQKEYFSDIRICDGDCIEIGVKKNRKLSYEWNAFGKNINSHQSKLEVCPAKLKNLYYLKVFDKKGTLVEMHKFRINIIKPEIEVTPEYLCILDDKPITIKLVESYDQVKWSNGSTQDSISTNKPGPLAVTVTTKEGCMVTRSLSVTRKRSSDIQKKLEDKGFYSMPIEIKKKKN